jgi:hypothetical protein
VSADSEKPKTFSAIATDVKINSIFANSSLPDNFAIIVAQFLTLHASK